MTGSRKEGWRRWRLPVAAALLVAGGLGVRLADGSDAGSWVPVERRDLVFEVDLEGELEAVRSTHYGPPPIPDVWEYKLSFMAEEGSRVSTGDPVIGFDTTQLEQRLLRRTADRDAAQRRLEKLESDLELQRKNSLLALAEAEARLRRAELKVEVPEEIISRQELRTSEVERQLALEEEAYRRDYLAYLDSMSKAEIEALQQERDRRAARVVLIEQKIDQMTVRARKPGTVIFKTDWQGNKKKVGDRVWRGETVVEIPDLDEMKAIAEVDEAEAGPLEVDQPVEFRLDAHPERTYSARVAKIAKTVRQRSWRDRRRVVVLELELEETDVERMRPGMRLQGSVEVGRLIAALTLPLQAVDPTTDPPSVQIRSVLGERSVAPTLGARSGSWVEVLDGLEEGDRVYVP